MRPLPLSTSSFWWLASKTTVTEDVTVPGCPIWDTTQWHCCQRKATQRILKNGPLLQLDYPLTTPNIFKIIVNFFKSWTFISRLLFLSHICDLNTPLFVLFLWQTLSVAVFSILLNQLRHHIINAPKNWGSVAFMVNCILNFLCAVFTFQASLHISCSDPYFACMKGLSSVPLSPLRKAFLHSNAIMQLTIRVQIMFLHNYILHSSDQQYSSCSRQRVALTLEISRGPRWSWMDLSSQS